MCGGLHVQQWLQHLAAPSRCCGMSGKHLGQDLHGDLSEDLEEDWLYQSKHYYWHGWYGEYTRGQLPCNARAYWRWQLNWWQQLCWFRQLLKNALSNPFLFSIIVLILLFTIIPLFFSIQECNNSHHGSCGTSSACNCLATDGIALLLEQTLLARRITLPTATLSHGMHEYNSYSHWYCCSGLQSKVDAFHLGNNKSKATYLLPCWGS